MRSRLFNNEWNVIATPITASGLPIWKSSPILGLVLSARVPNEIKALALSLSSLVERETVVLQTVTFKNQNTLNFSTY